MTNQRLQNYIKQQLQQGKNPKDIKNSLTSIGWQEQSINDAFSQLSKSASQPLSSSSPILPGPISLLTEAWIIFKQRFGVFLGIIITSGIASFIISLLISLIIAGSFFGFLQSASKFTSFTSKGILLLPILLIIPLAITAFVIQILSPIALIYAIKNSPEKIGIKESYSRSWHKFSSYCWVSFLTGFILLGAFLLFIIPGIVFAVWFSLAVFVLVAEDQKGLNAILKSKEYVRGKWLAVFWRLIFIFLFVIIAYLVPAIIFSFLKIPFVASLLQPIIALILFPLSTTYSFLIYHHLKSIKGEFEFVPSIKSKLTFILIGLLGLLIIPGSTFFLVLKGTTTVQKRARDSQREFAKTSVNSALKMYFSQNNQYPPALNQLVPQYLKEVPTDPKTKYPYEYHLESTQTYELCIDFENKPQQCFSSNTDLSPTPPSGIY